MKDLCKLLIADRPTFVLAKVEFDKITVEIERYIMLEESEIQHFLELI